MSTTISLSFRSHTFINGNHGHLYNIFISLAYFKQQADISCAQGDKFSSCVLLAPCSTQVVPFTYPMEAVRP